MDTTLATQILPRIADGTPTKLDVHTDPGHHRTTNTGRRPSTRDQVPEVADPASSRCTVDTLARVDVLADFLTRHPERIAEAINEPAARTRFLLTAGRAGAAHLTGVLRDVSLPTRVRLLDRATTIGRVMPHFMLCSGLASILWEYSELAPNRDWDLATDTVPFGLYTTPLWRNRHDGSAFVDEICIRGLDDDKGDPEAGVTVSLEFWSSKLGRNFTGLRYLPLLDLQDARWYRPDGTWTPIGDRVQDMKARAVRNADALRTLNPVAQGGPTEWLRYLKWMTPDPQPDFRIFDDALMALG